MRAIFIIVTVVLLACNTSGNRKKVARFEPVYATDTTSYIQWTDGAKIFRSSNTIDNHYVDEKTYIQWTSDRFMCLRHYNGSDTWTDIILPFNHSGYKMFENPLAYDKPNGIVVYETDSLHFKLVAENISSGEKEFIGADWESCSSVFPHYCIQNISVQDRVLSVEWVTPNRIDQPNKRVLKEIELRIR